MREITSVQHPLVKQLVRLRDRRSDRYSDRLVLVEGRNMLAELSPSTSIVHLLTNDIDSVPSTVVCDDIVLVSDAVIRKITACETPSGLVAVAKMPSTDPEALLTSTPQRLLILDGVSDPGNLGTILRSAAAFGWEAIYCLPGCCDPFNPKAIRAAKGATFRVPMAIGGKGALEGHLSSYTVLTADLEGEEASHYVNNTPLALVLSSEAHGVQDTLSGTQPVTIPMHGEMESLNVAVAGAILMNALQRNTHD